MDNVDATHDELTHPAAVALETVVDPVLAVTSGTITYANAAARDAFELAAVGESREEAAVLGTLWDRLSEALDETIAGTARYVELEDERYDAHVHRRTDGATITFERGRDGYVPDDDRAAKARSIDEAPVGVSISDPSMEDNPLVYINRAYRELTGYSTDDVVGRNCRLLQGPDSDPEAIATMRAGIDAEEPVTVELKNYRKDGTEFWNEVTIAPVRNDEGEVTNYVGFQNDVTARKTAELEVEQRTEELEYLLERVQGLIQDVTTAVAGSTARSDLEGVVCDRIAGEAAYEGAWIGERNPATDTIEVRASAVVEPEAVSIDAEHPAARTLSSGDPTIETIGGHTHASFPLLYNEIEYGVLTVCTSTERAIEERETVILSALARAVASGINARETSRMLATDAVVAVDVDLTDRALSPVAISADAACRLEYRRSVHRSRDETASLFTVTGASVDEVVAATDALEGVEVQPLVDRADGCLIELAADDGLVGWLSDRGVLVHSLDAEAGSARLTLEIPRSRNIRSIVEALEERYPGANVASFHQRERSGETREELAVTLEEELTERQFVALQRAYLGGYFEWPRPTTGEELAESMGVSRPTFHEHLRTAEGKLCRAFFGDGDRGR